MKNSLDPTLHRDREKQFIEHVRALLDDERLRLDTTHGRRSVGTLFTFVRDGEPGVERGERVKRLMMDLGVADRELQARLPVGERVDMILRMRNFWMLKKRVGELVVTCVSPTRELIQGDAPKPLDAAAVSAYLSAMKRTGGSGPEVPLTIVLMSTSGFTTDARELVGRTANRTLVMVEPNDAGGWSVYGPPETRELSDLFDPERDEAKRQRVREYLQENQFELMSGGIAADRIAGKTQLPLQIVEAALKSYARDNPGLAARRLEGKLMLYRDGSTMLAADSAAGGSNMPFWETIKGIFHREESAERKIARLSAERASLSAQRERAYDEIAAVEKRESELTKSFKEATALAQRRIATEISQLRKDIERRQQILGAIDKKINVINTGIHTLELQNHVSPEKLKALENVAASSEEVEVGLAALQQLDEEANASAGIGAMDVPDDVQAIMDELRGHTESTTEPASTTATPPQRVAQTESRNQERTPAERTSTPAAPERRRNEPEAG